MNAGAGMAAAGANPYVMAAQAGMEVVGTGLDMANNIVQSNTRADNQINDYRNFAYKNMANKIKNQQDNAVLQDNQARQMSSMQINLSGSGTDLSSSNSVGTMGELSKSQGMEQTNLAVNQQLTQMQLDQNLRDQNSYYNSARLGSEMGGFSKAVNSFSSGLSGAMNQYNATEANNAATSKLNGGAEAESGSWLSNAGQYGKYFV